MTRNIVSNNCVGAMLCNLNDQPFTNPFVWAAESPKDFVKLVNDFETIDFQNVEFSLEKLARNDRESVRVTLSNGIVIHFVHYMMDERYDEPHRPDIVNVRYSNIMAYAKEKWYSRVDRMKDQPDPVYLYCFNLRDPKKYGPYADDLEVLWTVKKPLVLVMDSSVDVPKRANPNITILRYPTDVMMWKGRPFSSHIKDDVFAAMDDIISGKVPTKVDAPTKVEAPAKTASQKSKLVAKKPAPRNVRPAPKTTPVIEYAQKQGCPRKMVCRVVSAEGDVGGYRRRYSKSRR